MGCHHPLKAFSTGRLTENGKTEYLIFEGSSDKVSFQTAQKKDPSLRPGHLRLVDGFLVDPIDVPCGKCVGCNLERSRVWTSRLILEAQEHDFAYFLTITYDDLHLPIDRKGEAYLKRKDLTNFLKRLRYYWPVKFRYFACGEYGESINSTHRPHYHLILFADSPLPLSTVCMTMPNRFHSSVVSAAWTFGIHEVSFADPGCMAYVAGYVVKKNLHKNDHTIPAFITMSRMPAIGSQYLSKHDLSDGKIYGPFSSSKNANALGIPRAFMRKLEKLDPSTYELIKAHHEQSRLLMKGSDLVRYQTHDPSIAGFLADDESYRRLKRMRKESL